MDESGNGVWDQPRTDLALEVRESFPEDDVEIQGVTLEKEHLEKENITVTRVEILNEEGAKAMGKPIGNYITIEAPDMEKEENNEALSEELAKDIMELAGDLGKEEGVLKKKSILIAGLGNRSVTPDSLGPLVVEQLFVTRHLIREYGEEFREKHKMGTISAITPGVMAQTGMETSEILCGIIRETKPELLIVIDALAARSVARLNTTIQITDTGISPGSGVGNHRNALNQESLSVKVIAIGVPTVVDAQTIVRDTMERMLKVQEYSEQEINLFMGGIVDEDMRNLFVTPKNIDDAMRRISDAVAEALNSCFL